MFDFVCLGLRPCLAALVWDCVLVWLRLFETASLFDFVCLGLRPCLAALVWDYVLVWLRVQTLKQSRRLKLPNKPKGLKPSSSAAQTKPKGFKLPNMPAGLKPSSYAAQTSTFA